MRDGAVFPFGQPSHLTEGTTLQLCTSQGAHPPWDEVLGKCFGTSLSSALDNTEVTLSLGLPVCHTKQGSHRPQVLG